MIYPSNFEQKIGFDTIREKVKLYCKGEVGKEYVKNMTFSNDFDKINIEISQTEEFRQILLFDNTFPNQDYYNLIPELVTLRLENTFIESESMLELATSLRVISKILTFLNEDEKNKYPFLRTLSEPIKVDDNIIYEIDKIIDERGEIKDNASEELLVIRKSMKKLSASIDGKLEEVFRSARSMGWIPENSEPTIRNGRVVIPVISAHKRKINGFIHDESATGQTSYIEPIEVFEANNRIVELQNSERREILRILTLFTNFIRPFIDELIEAYKFLGIIDFIRSKARFAIEIGGVKPLITNASIINWLDARHPLLYLSLKEHKKETVTSHINLDEKQRILIISGPNAGGKSVLLRSVGLLQYMLQCGLLISVRETSETGIFDNIFIDIGDEQSIDDDMSTYSSHLQNMKNIMQYSNNRSLFMIDEMGGGTEPQLGGVIAEAILENLNSKKSKGVVTTHYGNLKMMSTNNPGIVNGAMLFDMKKLQPLFKLKIGYPGSSFAFEIADKIGLDRNVINTAKEKLGDERVNFDAQLQQLEIERELLEKQKKEFEIADTLLKQLTEKYNKLNTKLEDQKRTIIDKARNEAELIIKGANKLIETTIREIKEVQADKEQTKKIRNNFQTEGAILSPENHKKQVDKKQPDHKTVESIESNELKIGDLALLKEQGVHGEIISIKDGFATVIFNSVKLSTNITNLEKITAKQAKNINQKNKIFSSDTLDTKLNEFKLTLDLRGKRAEESIEIVNKYIDDAVLLSIKEFKILHGKGNGILRSVIRRELSTNRQVLTFADEAVEFGGDGITVVKLK